MKEHEDKNNIHLVIEIGRNSEEKLPLYFAYVDLYYSNKINSGSKVVI